MHCKSKLLEVPVSTLSQLSNINWFPCYLPLITIPLLYVLLLIFSDSLVSDYDVESLAFRHVQVVALLNSFLSLLGRTEFNKASTLRLSFSVI